MLRMHHGAMYFLQKYLLGICDETKCPTKVLALLPKLAKSLQKLCFFRKHLRQQTMRNYSSFCSARKTTGQCLKCIFQLNITFQNSTKS